MDLERIPVEFYKARADEWRSIPHSKQIEFLEHVSKALGHSNSTYKAEWERYKQVYEIVHSDKLNRDDGKGDALSDLLKDQPIPEDEGRKIPRSKTPRKHVAPLLFWFAYFYPKEAKEYLEKIGLQFAPIEEVSELPGRLTEYLIEAPQPDLGLINPAEQKEDLQTNIQIQFGAKSTKFTGRIDETNELLAFVGNEKSPSFKWWQIAGAGGQGKSRIAVELFENINNISKWEYGFLKELNSDFINKINSYPCNLNLLIVIDYASAPTKEDLITDLIFSLNQLSKTTRGKNCILRLLIIDRQPYDLSLGQLSTQNAMLQPGRWQAKLADPTNHRWCLARTTLHGGKDSRPLFLSELKDDDLKIIARSWTEYRGKQFTENIEKQICTYLRLTPLEVDNEQASDEIDTRSSRAKRPLMAILAAEAVLSQIFPPEDREVDYFEFLLRAITREDIRQSFRLSRNDPRETSEILDQETTPIQRNMAAFANIVGSYDALSLDAPTLDGKPLLSTKRHDINNARKLLGYSIISEGNGETEFLTERQPDLLAEFQVTAECTKANVSTTRALIALAWETQPEKTASFFFRLSQDFIKADIVKVLFQSPPKEPRALSLWAALASTVLASIEYKLKKSDFRNVVDSLLRSGKSDGADVIFSMTSVCILIRNIALMFARHGDFEIAERFLSMLLQGEYEKANSDIKACIISTISITIAGEIQKALKCVSEYGQPMVVDLNENTAAPTFKSLIDHRDALERMNHWRGAASTLVSTSSSPRILSAFATMLCDMSILACVIDKAVTAKSLLEELLNLQNVAQDYEQDIATSACHVIDAFGREDRIDEVEETFVSVFLACQYTSYPELDYLFDLYRNHYITQHGWDKWFEFIETYNLPNMM